MIAGAVALAVRQDSRGANSSHVVVPSSATDPENTESVTVSEGQGSAHAQPRD